MSQLAPPAAPPCAALADDDGVNRLGLRLWQGWWSFVTIVATVWCFKLGWIPGIIALITAKHILVAILVLGLGVDSQKERLVPPEA